jgi:beta-lactamase superfamily II metal-dependent hydrolase
MAYQGEMHLRIWDVQHGACAMLWHRLNGADGKLAMIDSGSADDWTPSNYLRQQRVVQVDYLFITNADQDHLSDLDSLWQQNIPVRTLTRNPHPPAADLRRIKAAGGLSNDIERYLAIHETYNSPVTQPFNLHMGGITQKTFYNPYPQFQDTNNLSCVVSIEFAGFRILLPGDLEDFRNELAGVHVLVASHHGRESGYCEAVFDYCSPWAVVMSDKAIVHDTQNMAQTYRRHVVANRPNGVFVRTTGRQRHVLTTRNDGHVHFNVAANGNFTIDTEYAG